MCFRNVCIGASFFRTAKASACSLLRFHPKPQAGVLEAVKKVPKAVKSESLFRGCLANVSANNNRDAATQFWSLFYHMKRICCGDSNHARPVAIASHHGSKTKYQGLYTCILYLVVNRQFSAPIAESSFTLNRKAVSYRLPLLVAEEKRCSSRSLTPDETREPDTSCRSPAQMTSVEMANQHPRGVQKSQPHMWESFFTREVFW